MNRLIKKINPISKIIWQFLIFGLIISIFFGFVLNKAEAANITISGTLYSDAGITNAGSGKTIKIAVGTSTPSVHSTSTETDGVWSVTDIDNSSLSTTTPITVWLDGDANDAVTLVAGYSSSNITSVPVYYGYTIVNATSSTAVLEVSNFTFYDSSDDSDILYLITSTSTTVNSNLLIKQGNFKAPTTTLNIAGNFTNNSTFSANYGTVDMTGSSKEINGVLTGNSAFYDLVISGSYTISSSSASTTNLWIKNGGSLVAPVNTTVSGNFSNAGTFDNNDGTLYVDNLRSDIINYISGLDINGLSNGTSSVSVSTMYIYGNYLYVGKASNATACSQTAGSASGCELQVYDISSSTNPTYVAGRDVDGSDSGISSISINSVTLKNSYLYISKASNATACSQTAGSASGCELMVFDISSSTNPTYVAGRDANGSNGGSASVGFNTLVKSDNYIYVGSTGSSTACSQTAGSASGCELQVYDISSSTNPTYVAGRDANGLSNGTSSVSVSTMYIYGNYLYVGKASNATACSQTAGSASGCELMVFDISSSTNPTYVAGRDANGSNGGSASVGFNTLVKSDNYIYVGSTGSSTACSQATGSARGCELTVFNSQAGLISGELTSGNALANLNVKGNSRFYSTASTSDFIIQANSTSTILVSSLTLSGDYVNNGVAIFDDTTNLYVASAGTQTLSGNLNSFSALPKTIFSGSGTKTISSVASTSDLIIDSGVTLETNYNLSIKGNFTNNGTFEGNETELFGNFTNNGNLSGQAPDLSIKSYITNFLAGRDITGSGIGTTTNFISYSSVVVGNYLYMSLFGNTTACSQITGSATGCELQVYDISSSTNPLYVAGRDSDGSSNGTTSVSIFSMIATSSYLYVGKNGNTTACSQITGSATGCELMVFDISSSTNPTYVAGRDADGSNNGVNFSLGSYVRVIHGNSLYIGTEPFPTAGNCSQITGSATGCELQVYDISSSTNPIYVAGRDADGSDSGPVFGYAVYAINQVGNYLYVGSTGSSTPCSQTAGSAAGCELQVYDISSSTNPIYVAGRDSSGSSNGTLGTYIYTIATTSQSLIIGLLNSSTACSQTAGSASGCELQVYDISSSTNPIYVAGRDADGSDNGTGVESVRSIFVKNNLAYVAKNGNPTTCYGTAGLGLGCEIMVYDISSSTNPVFVDGRDTDGTREGVSDINLGNLTGGYDYIYVAKSVGFVSCSNSTGIVEGCALQIYGIVPTVSGSFTGTNSLGDLTIIGQGAIFQSNASTTNFTISTSSTLTAPSYLTVAGDMANYGTFTHSSGTVFLSGINKSLISPATTTFYNLTKNSTTTDILTFTAGGTYITKGELNLSGTAGNGLSLRSSSSTGEWYIDPQATATLAYLDVEDSNNINVTTVTCDTSCIDSGNNTGWVFNDQVLMESTADYHFYVGQATTTLDQIVVTKLSESENITAINDIRINIATTTSDMRFDSSVTTLTFGGTASGKVNNTVSYEDGDATLLINVTSDFSADDTLTINGIELGDFSTISITTSNLKLYTSGSIIGSPTTIDTKSIYITGDLVLDDHTLGQVDNVFSFQSYSDKTMFAFSLDPNNENATVTDMVVTLSGVQDINDTNLTDWRLYKDNNNDGDIDGGDTLIDSAGIMTINDQFGAVTFSSDFLVTSTNDYIITSDIDSIARGGAVTMSIDTSDITTTGVTSGQFVVVIGSVTNLQHIRNGAGAGGGSARIGDEPPAGNGVVTGGGGGGGGGSDNEEDGENIAFNPNFIKPTDTGDSFNEWTNPNNALISDGSYATANSAGLRQSYNGFGLNIPNGNTIQGIEVKIDASGTTADGTISVALSWDGGSSYTTGKATPTLSGSDIVYSVGDNSDTWGRSWNASEFDLGNFRLRVTATPNSNTIRLDAIEVRVYHQVGGGGAGGGGGI